MSLSTKRSRIDSERGVFLPASMLHLRPYDQFAGFCSGKTALPATKRQKNTTSRGQMLQP